jgi:nitroreductase
VFAAAQNMLVAARALGLGTTFTTLHRFVEPGLRELLALPSNVEIAVTMPLGWPARDFGPLTRRPMAEVVHHDRW